MSSHPANDAIHEYYATSEHGCVSECEQTLPLSFPSVRDVRDIAPEHGISELEQVLAEIIGDVLDNHVPAWVWPILKAYLQREPLDFEGLVVPTPIQEVLVAHFLDDLGVAN